MFVWQHSSQSVGLCPTIQPSPSEPTTSNPPPNEPTISPPPTPPPTLVLQVAHVAHLGGALAGVALAVALTKLPR